MSIIIAILIFSFIIIFHEFGHFIVAKAFDVRVNEFTLGLGPTIFSVQGKETKFCLNLLPFGGSCVMEGEDEESDDERAFNKKPLWQKALIVFAGPLFNFILAFILSMILLGALGYDRPIVEDVMDGYPAQEAGLTSGDEITSLNGFNIHFYNEISIYTFFHTGETLDVEYIRDGHTYHTSITPKYDEDTDRYYLGIQGNTTRVKGNALTVVKYSFYEIRYQIYVTLQSLKMLFTGQLGVQDMSGPVGIVKTIGDSYTEASNYGVFVTVMQMINIAILLTANLGVMNLIPFPALDGGRLLIFFIEGITRRKIDERIEGGINFVGFALLMMLMIVVMISDISKLL
ncbi:MAG: M50 family metallopeptidase [Lachnospiraceae bacterium]|nr:M50 family metallopeptidase [Lachnospiraceae bacterium]